MKKFRTVVYELELPGIKKEDVTVAVIADLHGLEFGTENQLLEAAIRENQADAVLVAGDMVVRTDSESLDRAAECLERIANRYPVYYALGNHEYQIYSHPDARERYEKYEDRLKRAGVVMLRNERSRISIRETEFVFYGLELPLVYYHKPKSPDLSMKSMVDLIGKPEEFDPSENPGVNVLLAHNPKYGRTYLEWGADLTISGHYHGGILRLDKHHGVISPQFQLFPRYCCGDFHRGDSHMIVSAGLGEHTIPLRIHNPRELVIIKLKKINRR